jgi:sRNA-binding carbon storage regulator CsrA
MLVTTRKDGEGIIITNDNGDDIRLKVCLAFCDAGGGR